MPSAGARLKHALVTAWLCCAGCLAGIAVAADFVAGPNDYRTFLPRLTAGDRLLLSAGDYERGLPLRGLSGEPGRPIVIAGPATGPRARFIARAGANTVSLVDVRHLQIQHLELDGGNQRVDAVKAEGHAAYAHFVTLENLYIHDHAASQQNVGISTKCPAFGWVVRGNRIERVGTGMYFGNSNGAAPFVAGLIEDNTISDTVGYNLQIKHQLPRPENLPGAGERHDTVIRKNLFDRTHAGPPGPMARPNVLIGHMPKTGQGMHDRTLIYANLFWQNPGESLFQGEGNLALYNNLLVTDGPDAIRIQPHNDVPREVRVLFNTVVASGNGITVLEPEHNPYTQLVAGNVIFAARPLQGGMQRENLVGSRASAGRYLARPNAELVTLDLTPRHGKTPTRRIDPAWLRDLPDIERDHAGQLRTPNVIGALIGPPRRKPRQKRPSPASGGGAGGEGIKGRTYAKEVMPHWQYLAVVGVAHPVTYPLAAT